MIDKMLSSRKAIERPELARDILIDFINELHSGVKNKEPLEKIIKSISKKNITMSDIVTAYSNLLKVSELSIFDNDLKYNNRQLPTTPSDKNIIERIKKLIS